jgi:hypothetical protein
MTPEEALDLLPLLAAGELDEEQRASVRVALASRPGVAEELEKWTELDGLLERSLAPASARCGSCQKEAPKRAAYCPWCGEKLGGGASLGAARMARFRPFVGFAASVALLLPGSLGVGFIAQRELEKTWWEAKGSVDALEDEAEARTILGSVVAAQKTYRTTAQNGEFAPDLDSLSLQLEKDETWQKARRGRFSISTEASLSRPDERFFACVARGTRGVFTNEHGRVQRLSRGLMIDRIRCALVAWHPGRDPREEERETSSRPSRTRRPARPRRSP